MMKALIVEDNDLYRNVLEIVLVESGFRVSTSTNGQKALEILLENLSESFDLIVTDYEMPLMNGSELIKAILKNNILFKKLILLSGSGDLNDQIREFKMLDKNISVVPKDTPISHLRQNHFKI